MKATTIPAIKQYLWLLLQYIALLNRLRAYENVYKWTFPSNSAWLNARQISLHQNSELQIFSIDVIFPLISILHLLVLLILLIL